MQSFFCTLFTKRFIELGILTSFHNIRTKVDIMIIAEDKILCKCPRLCSSRQVFEKNLCAKFGVSLYIIGSAEHFPIIEQKWTL